MNNKTHPFCIVVNPGTDREYVEETQHRTHAAALKEVKRAHDADIHVDVAKRLEDGSLTYEF